MASDSTRQSRRRPAEVRALLLGAASQEFAERGLHAVTTRDICERAGVSLSAMYRHFADKDELFREAMLAPLTGFADDFAALWEAQRTEPWDDYRLMRSFLESLQSALSGRRDSLLALAAAERFEDWDVVGELHRSVGALFDRLAAIGSEEAARRGWFSADRLDLAIRLIVGMSLGFVAFEPLLRSGAAEEVPIEMVLDEIAALVIWGLRREPGTS
jgi:AcrR family transcriptional regulator